jgi:hypothetical protein
MTEIILGSECDDDLFHRLVAEVEQIGGSIIDKKWVLGGSQEFATFQISLPDGKLEAVAETYLGLSIRGASPLVESLAHRVAATSS